MIRHKGIQVMSAHISIGDPGAGPQGRGLESATGMPTLQSRFQIDIR